MISWSPRRRVSLAALIVALALAAACSSSNPTSPGATPAVNSPGTGTTGSGGTGTLRVMLKDAPTNASAVLVGFSEVSVHRSAGVGTDTGEWKRISTDPTITCDLIKLSDPADPQTLAVGTIAEGHYTQIRLSIAPIPPTNSMSVALYEGGTKSTSDACVAGDATVMAPTGTEATGPFSVNVPSGEIKLNHQFDVSAGTTLTIVLDFDAGKSIHQTGNHKYMMTPVISISSAVVGP